ncbi:hypothetical protein A33M_2199 [Rhodovulum sp. PH10]|nr:hypothetical protein A33M_2199 [Rhodovulum sp. PH10]
MEDHGRQREVGLSDARAHLEFENTDPRPLGAGIFSSRAFVVAGPRLRPTE